ncbi:MAG: PadR family transcriptional regulator [Clostridiales Family XIII bacterium]|jgi:PadR family transcriptional regulator PadR|nr:PadR family transcriptional regulator [Clostridiales Family XIII bacterium]
MVFQIGATLLDACVLSVLRGEDTYGYSLTQTLRGSLDISESTLYPVLRRLQKEACLTVRDEAYQGRNRRYYSITEKGMEKAREYRGAWEDFRGRVDGLILGGAAS